MEDMEILSRLFGDFLSILLDLIKMLETLYEMSKTLNELTHTLVNCQVVSLKLKGDIELLFGFLYDLNTYLGVYGHWENALLKDVFLKELKIIEDVLNNLNKCNNAILVGSSVIENDLSSNLKILMSELEKSYINLIEYILKFGQYICIKIDYDLVEILNLVRGDDLQNMGNVWNAMEQRRRVELSEVFTLVKVLQYNIYKIQLDKLDQYEINKKFVKFARVILKKMAFLKSKIIDLSYKNGLGNLGKHIQNLYKQKK